MCVCDFVKRITLREPPYLKLNGIMKTYGPLHFKNNKKNSFVIREQKTESDFSMGESLESQ